MLDLLQIQIEKAKSMLPPETRKAIENVDWRKVIFEMKDRRGYTLSQLEDLELETELVLCGLSNPLKYTDQLESGMKIPRNQAIQLTNEMNLLVFKKIREELVRILDKNPNTSDKKIDMVSVNQQEPKEVQKDTESELLTQTKIHIENKKEESQNDAIINSIPAQRLVLNTFKIPSTVTNHSVGNIGKEPPAPQNSTVGITTPKVDPYREMPE